MSSQYQFAGMGLDQLFQEIDGNLKRFGKMIQKLEHRVTAIEAESLVRQKGRTPRMPIEFRSQFGEDVFLWELFGRKTEGYFIEVGAFDGYHFSVTYALEAMGWNGLLIEAIPGPAAECGARRRESKVVHAALGRRNAPPTARFTVVDDWYGGMFSYNQTTALHQERVNKLGLVKREVEVPQTTMDDLLKGHAGTIDLASIDVEGGELDVLDGFDLKSWAPRVLLLEDNLPGGDPRLASYMDSMPYSLLTWIDVNRVYVHQDAAEISARAQRYLTGRFE